MTPTVSTEARFCSVCARQAGLDPIGYGGAAYATIIAVETPLPWPQTLWSDSTRMPPEVLALMEHIRDEYARTHTVQIRLLGIAPDPAYAVAGVRRVICWRRPAGPFAQFERREYLVPDEQIGPLVWALAMDTTQLALFAAHQVSGTVRDLLVCTHGSVDAACSKFGYPTYRMLREMAAESSGLVRVWRTTHFGGHVFAPTLIDLPHGSYWAYIGREEAALLLQRRGELSRLRGHYRGWAGLPAPFLQVLERELLLRYGWAWLTYEKAGHVLAEDQSARPDADGESEPGWADVQLEYRAPDGSVQGVVVARIELTSRVETIYSSNEAETYAYPQYTVTRLEQFVR